MNFLSKIFTKKQSDSKKGALQSLDKQQIQEAWLKIEQLSSIGKPSAFREAVIEADKLVDFALGKVYPGRETAAERLKEAKELFQNSRADYDNLWYAHKLRNEMVHTVGFELPSVEAKRVLDHFKKALEILGAL